jgi:hypothetical protein
MYRELNIMNRLSNKDFSVKSYPNFNRQSFSDVFRFASCVQSFCAREPDELLRALFGLFPSLAIRARNSLQGIR